jgi:hypothetical protein
MIEKSSINIPDFIQTLLKAILQSLIYLMVKALEEKNKHVPNYSQFVKTRNIILILFLSKLWYNKNTTTSNAIFFQFCSSF